MDPSFVWTVVCCQAVFLAVLVAFCRPRPVVDSKSEPASYTWENFMADVEAGIPIDIIHEKCLRFGVPRRPRAAMTGIYFPGGIHLPDGSIPWIADTMITPNVTLEVTNGTGHCFSNNNASFHHVSFKPGPLSLGDPGIQRFQ